MHPEFPKEPISLEESLDPKLKDFEDKVRQGERERSALGWFFLTCCLADISLGLLHIPGLSALVLGISGDLLFAIKPTLIQSLQSFALEFFGAFQLGLLLLGTRSLRRSVWRVVSLPRLIRRRPDSPAIRGTLAGLLSGGLVVVIGYLYAPTVLQSPFAVNLNDDSFRRLEMIILAISVLGVLATITPSFGSAYSSQESRLVIKKASNRAHYPVHCSKERVLPLLKFHIDAEGQNLVVLRVDRHDKCYRVMDFQDADRPVVLKPTEESYDILNLSALKRRKDFVLKVDAPDRSFRFTFTLSAKINSASCEDMTAVKLHPLAVRAGIESFFKEGEDAFADLSPEMAEALKGWLGDDINRTANIIYRCEKIGRDIELGQNDTQSEPCAIVRAPSILANENERLALAVAKQSVENRRKARQNAEAELKAMAAEIDAFKTRLFCATKDLGKHLEDEIKNKVKAKYCGDDSESFRQTLEFMFRIAGIKLVNLSVEELPYFKTCEAAFDTAQKRVASAISDAEKVLITAATSGDSALDTLKATVLQHETVAQDVVLNRQAQLRQPEERNISDKV